MAKCTECGQQAGFMTTLCNSCIAEDARQRGATVEVVLPKSEIVAAPATSGSPRVLALTKRYQDAYLVAKITIGIGSTIKTAGMVLAVLIFLGTLMLASSASQQGGVFFAALLVGGFNGFVIGFVFYFVGIMISAQGQVLQASLDNTIGNSPFLTDELKARVMSLPEA